MFVWFNVHMCTWSGTSRTAFPKYGFIRTKMYKRSLLTWFHLQRKYVVEWLVRYLERIKLTWCSKNRFIIGWKIFEYLWVYSCPDLHTSIILTIFVRCFRVFFREVIYFLNLDVCTFISRFVLCCWIISQEFDGMTLILRWYGMCVIAYCDSMLCFRQCVKVVERFYCLIIASIDIFEIGKNKGSSMLVIRAPVFFYSVLNDIVKSHKSTNNCSSKQNKNIELVLTMQYVK